MANPKQQKQIPDVTIRNAEFRFLNFEGRADAFNEAGEDNRNFQVILPADLAAAMADDEWNIKETRPRRNAEPDELAEFEPRPYIEVKVSYKFDSMAPKVYLVTPSQMTLLSAATAQLVDSAEIVKMALTINPSRWTLGSKSGVKAYLKEAYITIRESELAQEYSSIPLAGTTQRNVPSFS